MAGISAVDFFCQDTPVKFGFAEKRPSSQHAGTTFIEGGDKAANKNVAFNTQRPWTPESTVHTFSHSPMSMATSTTESSDHTAFLPESNGGGANVPFLITPAILLQRRHSMDTALYNPPPTPEGSICDDEDEELDLYDTTEGVEQRRPSLSSRSYSIDAGMLHRFAQHSLAPLVEGRTEDLSRASSLSTTPALRDIPEHAQMRLHHGSDEASDSEEHYVSMNMVDTSPLAPMEADFSRREESALREINYNGQVEYNGPRFDEYTGPRPEEYNGPRFDEKSSHHILGSAALSTFKSLQSSRMAGPLPQRVPLQADYYAYPINAEESKHALPSKPALQRKSSNHRLKKSASESAFKMHLEQPPKSLSRRVSMDDLHHGDKGGRPFVCQMCSSSFVRAHDLKRHSKIHDEGIRLQHV